MRRVVVSLGIPALAAIALIALVAHAPRPAVGSAGQVTVVTYGGSYGEALNKAFFEPFEKATGIKVVKQVGPDFAKLKAMVQSQNVQWDLYEGTTHFLLDGVKEALLEPIDYGIVRVPELPQALKHSHGVGYMSYAGILAYSTKTLLSGASRPGSWRDFWDVKKFPGKRALFKRPAGTLEFALLADGVPLDKLYPLDVERAFRSLERIKPHVSVWYSAIAQPIQLLQTGELDMAMTFNGRVEIAKRENVPIDFVWDGGYITYQYFMVPKGAPNRENAMKLIKFALDAEQQMSLPRFIPGYGPANPAAFDRLPMELKRTLPTYEANRRKLFLLNGDWWAGKLEPLAERLALMLTR